MKFLIIGGGFTGLTAAYELLKNNHEVVIIERSNVLGGLASGFKIEGENIEKTYHHIFTTDTDIIGLVTELGLEKKLEWHDSSVAICYDNKLYPFNGALDLIKFSPLSFISRIRVGLIVLFLQKFKNWKSFLNISAFDWMRKFAGKNASDVIWEPLLKGKFSHFYDKVSMAWLWARLHIRANSRKAGEGEKLGYFNGSFNIIIKELKKRIIEMGGKIFVRSEFKEFVERDDSFEANIESGNKVFSEVVDKIICTVPSGAMGEILMRSPEGGSHHQNPNQQLSSDLGNYIQKLKNINYLGAICMVFSSDQDLSDFYWHNINDLKAPFLVFINHTKLIPKSRYNNKNIYYIGAYLPHEHKYFKSENTVIEKDWFNYLKKIFPEFDQKQINQLNIFKFKNAQHIVDLDYTSKIPGYETPIKNIYLANFSQIFPEDRGTNFAIREGIKIAKLAQNLVSW
jgi:protoporphyrinogen oxidase